MIRHIFWQDYVKNRKGKTISLILGWLLRPMALVDAYRRDRQGGEKEK